MLCCRVANMRSHPYPDVPSLQRPYLHANTTNTQFCINTCCRVRVQQGAISRDASPVSETHTEHSPAAAAARTLRETASELDGAGAKRVTALHNCPENAHCCDEKNSLGLVYNISLPKSPKHMHKPYDYRHNEELKKRRAHQCPREMSRKKNRFGRPIIIPIGRNEDKAKAHQIGHDVANCNRDEHKSLRGTKQFGTKN